MKKALGYFQKIENGVLIGTFIIMVIASFVQVLNRNIFHLGISWLEELSRYCMIYMALLAAEIGLRDGTQIAVTALTDKLKGTFKNVVEIIAKAVVCAFAVTVFVGGNESWLMITKKHLVLKESVVSLQEELRAYQEEWQRDFLKMVQKLF